jgi:RimJ/RimL family protein N-acetyltransferase
MGEIKMNLIIRKARKGDAKYVAEIFNDGLKTGFYKYTGSNCLRDKKKINEMDKQYSKENKHFCFFVAIDQETKKIVGSAGFQGRETGRLSHRVELGWGVNSEYAKKGIATRLVNELIKEAKKRGFKRVEAEACVENLSSVKLAKKTGFKIEGKRKLGMRLDNGQYVDTYLFGRTL